MQSMNKNTSIAILISTYNWPQALELVLLSLMRQSIMPNEIIIADDGSDDRTKNLIDEYRYKFTIPIKHVWQEDIGFRKSLILNKAVKVIEANYIIQIDGDIIVHKHFVKDHFNNRIPGYFVQGSRSMITEQKSKEILRTRQIDFSCFSKGLYSRFNALRYPILSKLFVIDPSNPFHIKGCNFAFWHQDFIRVNGYNNQFNGWGAEDYEFGARLLHAGVKRKRLKMAALGFHIYHTVNSRSNRTINDGIYQHTLSNKLITIPNGYSQI